MKKILSVALALMLIVSLALSIVGCDAAESLLETNPRVGTYYIYEMSMEGQTIDRELMEEAGIDYKEVSLKFNSDNSCTMNVDGEDFSGKWDDDSIYDSSDDIPYTYANGKITIDYDGVEMVFAKD